jgi:RND family efflux transporter MFP subunit
MKPMAPGLGLLIFATLAGGGESNQPAAGAFPGIVQAQEEIVLSSAVDELVAETPVAEGQAVRQGEVVLKLRDAEQQLELRRSAAVLRKARFDAAASQALVKDKIVSQDKSLEQEVRLELAEIDCETARIKAEERTLRSPITGILTKRLKDTGESVSRMEPVAEVMSIDRVFVLLNLPESLRATLRRGSAAVVEVPSISPSRRFPGKIDFIDPVVNPGSGLFRVKILLENPAHELRPGMRAHVSLEGHAAAARQTAGAGHQETSGGSPKDSSSR